MIISHFFFVQMIGNNLIILLIMAKRHTTLG